jgi:hypothetical protein
LKQKKYACYIYKNIYHTLFINNPMKKNTLQDTTGFKNNHKENGILLVNNKESQNIINDINSIYDVLMRNKDITQKTLQKIINNIQGNFENTQFDPCGIILDMKFIKKYGQEIEKNKGIWQEILDRNCKNEDKITFLIPSVAKALSQFQGTYLYLNSLQTINKDSAEALSQFQGKELCLNTLQVMDKNSAVALSQFQGDFLSLNGFYSIDKDIAQILAQFQGPRLSLDGVKSIDKDIASALGKFQGSVLCLNGLCFIDKDSACALSQFKEGILELNALQSIDKDSALALSQFQGTILGLRGLQTIDEDSSIVLAGFQGYLDISNEIKKQINGYKEENNKNN